MIRIIKFSICLVAAPVLLVMAYLIVAVIGGLIPASLSTAQAVDESKPVTIYLTGTLLHTDIAVPATRKLREQYGFLRATGFPLDNPNLKYLVFGWGSEVFYTETADYADIKFATAWKAATGDRAVLHIGPAGDLSQSPDVTPLHITENQLEELLEFIDSHLENQFGEPELVEGASFGYGDVFYRAKGNFNLLNPCNVWVSAALRAAGLRSGIWTPTSYSLLISQKLYN